MGQSTLDGDVLIRGNLSVSQSIGIPAGTVTNTMINANADIDASKLEHQFSKTFSQALGIDCASEARVLHVVYGASGTLIAFRAGAVVVAGAATTVAVDLKKNGTTVLTGTITLNNTQAAYQEVDGTLSVVALVTGDVLTVHLTLAGVNEPQGVYANLVLREDAA